MIHTKNGLKRLKDVNWDEISWKIIDKKISLLQQRIFKASRNGNKSNVKYLQSVLIKLPDAKLLAVRAAITENIEKHIDKINKQKIITKCDKLKLTIKLKIDGKIGPIESIYTSDKVLIDSLLIPIILDQAKQILIKMALEPAWEAKFEPNSYGFRPGRNCHDAIISILNSVKSAIRPKWILYVNLKSCYDNIDHNYLLKCLDESPIYIIKQIKAWLQAGILQRYLPYNKDFENINFKNTIKSYILSNLLVNIALHGIEKHFKKWNLKLSEPNNFYTKYKENYKSLNIIRYSNDLVITHYNKERIVEAKQELKNWLNNTLKVLPNRIQIKFIKEGFDFLGFHIVSIYKNGKYITKIYPQKLSLKRIIRKAHNIIFSNKAAHVESLIIKLRPILLSWANYFKFSECNKTFTKLDYIVWQMLRKWINRRSTGGRTQSWNKYFPGTYTKFDGKIYKDKYVLKSSKNINEKYYLPKIRWITSQKWVKVKSNSSPYDQNNIYWTKRNILYANLILKQSKLLIKQNFLCSKCGGKISSWNKIKVYTFKKLSKSNFNKKNNKKILHRACYIEFINN